MSLDIQTADRTSAPAIAWREIAAGLWVGRADGFPVGTIERARRFTFTDPDGVVSTGFATLADAQAAAGATKPAAPQLDTPQILQARQLPIALALTGALVGTATITLCGYALTLL